VDTSSQMLRYERRRLQRLLRGQPLKALAQSSRLSLRTLRYLQQGVTVPRADSLGRLASVLGVGVETFFVEGRK